MPRACFVVNPVGGRSMSPGALEAEIRPLLGAHWQFSLRVTEERGDAKRIAAEAVAEGCDVVVATGGDGTVNEVVQSLVHSRTALAVLPQGTGNVWAREVGIPLDIPGAIGVLSEGYSRQVDVGVAGDRCFLLMAGIGYDAEVMRMTDSRIKRRLGMLAYVIRGIAVAAGYRGQRVTLDFGDYQRNCRALLVVVGNTRLYGGQVQVTRDACVDDGLLDVCVFRGVSLLRATWYLIQVLVGRHLYDPGVQYFRTEHVVIGADSPQPVQVDGELIGHTPATFTVKRRALKVIIPRGSRPELFSAEQP